MTLPRSVPLAAVVALVLMSAALTRGGVSPSVVRITELALAGGAAYLFDDAAASLTTVTPPGVWRRQARVVLVGTGVLTASWLGILFVLRWQDSRHPLLLPTIEVIVLSLLSLASAALLVRHGDPEPGGQVAPVVVLLGIGALIADVFVAAAIFMPWDAGDADLGRASAAWAGVGLLALAVIVMARRDPAGRRTGRRSRSSERPTGLTTR